jgi:hypothetical protein
MLVEEQPKEIDALLCEDTTETPLPRLCSVTSCGLPFCRWIGDDKWSKHLNKITVLIHNYAVTKQLFLREEPALPWIIHNGSARLRGVTLAAGQ